MDIRCLYLWWKHAIFVYVVHSWQHSLTRTPELLTCASGHTNRVHTLPVVTQLRLKCALLPMASLQPGVSLSISQRATSRRLRRVPSPIRRLIAINIAWFGGRRSKGQTERTQLGDGNVRTTNDKIHCWQNSDEGGWRSCDALDWYSEVPGSNRGRDVYYHSSEPPSNCRDYYYRIPVTRQTRISPTMPFYWQGNCILLSRDSIY
jgi:hypothetical protein